MSVKIDLVLLNARLTTKQDRCHGIIQNSAIACVNGNIFWVGPDDKLPNIPVEEEIDSEGRWVTPSLIDCHTHLVYDGKRAQEFEQRLNGLFYEEISNAGDGIVSTVTGTRQTSKQQLIDQSGLTLYINRLSEGR